MKQKSNDKIHLYQFTQDCYGELIKGCLLLGSYAVEPAQYCSSFFVNNLKNNKQSLAIKSTMAVLSGIGVAFFTVLAIPVISILVTIGLISTLAGLCLGLVAKLVDLGVNKTINAAEKQFKADELEEYEFYATDANGDKIRDPKGNDIIVVM